MKLFPRLLGFTPKILDLADGSMWSFITQKKRARYPNLGGEECAWLTGRYRTGVLRLPNLKFIAKEGS